MHFHVSSSFYICIILLCYAFYTIYAIYFSLKYVVCECVINYYYILLLLCLHTYLQLSKRRLYTCVSMCVSSVDFLVSKLYISFVLEHIKQHIHISSQEYKKNFIFLVVGVRYIKSSFRIHIGTLLYICPKPSCNVQVNVKPSSTSLYLGWLEIRRNNLKYTHLHTKSFFIYLGLQFFSIPKIYK